MLLLRFEIMKMLWFVLFILWIYLLSEVNGERLVKRGLMDNINDGIKYAGQMLGINTAADVANLVAKAFAAPAPSKNFDPSPLFQQQDDDPQSYEKKAATKINPTEIIGGLLRMIGFDAGKLGALAINAILMIAQLIGNTLSRHQQTKTHLKSSEENETHQAYDISDPAYNDQEKRSGRAHSDEGTPLDWILTNPPEGLKDFLQQITDQKLPEKLAEAVSKEEQQHGQGDCIKMLMCKSAPFIWGMQKSVSSRMQGDTGSSGEEDNVDAISTLFKNLPNIEEYRNNGHMCELRYSNFCSRNGS